MSQLVKMPSPDLSRIICTALSNIASMSGAGEDPRPGQREHLLREDAVQQRGAVDQGHEVHADQPQVGPRLGDQQVHQQGVVTRAVNTFLFSL